MRSATICFVMALALGTPGLAAGQVAGIDFHHDLDLLPKLARGDLDEVWKGEWSLLSVMVVISALNDPLNCSLVERPPEFSLAKVGEALAKAQREHPDAMQMLLFRALHPAQYELGLWLSTHRCESPQTQTMLRNLFTLFMTRTLGDGWNPDRTAEELRTLLSMDAVSPWPLTVPVGNLSDQVRSELIAAAETGYQLLRCTYSYGTNVETHYAWLYRVPEEAMILGGNIPIAMVGLVGCPPGGYSGWYSSIVKMISELTKQPGDIAPTQALREEEIRPFVRPGEQSHRFSTSAQQIAAVNENYPYLEDEAAARAFPNPSVIELPGQQVLACYYGTGSTPQFYWKDALPPSPSGSEPSNDWAAYLAAYFNIAPVALRHCPPGSYAQGKLQGWKLWQKPPR